MRCASFMKIKRSRNRYTAAPTVYETLTQYPAEQLHGYE